MATLLERLRAARESWVTVGGNRFKVRRPTDVELARSRTDDADTFIRRCVVDWDIKEFQLVPGGGGDAVPFDADLCVEWVQDDPPRYLELVGAIEQMIRQRFEQRDEAEKKSGPPSTQPS